MKHLVILGILCILCSCATAGAPSGTNWAALESETVSTQPLQFLPEIEPVNLRIPLFQVQSAKLGGSARLVVGGDPYIHPFGVDLGNGLAIDSYGNAFLDILKLLAIDTSAPFTVTRKSDSPLGGATTLTGDSAGVALKSPKAGGSVRRTEDGLALKNAAGKDVMTVALSRGTYSYHSSIPLDPNTEMQATEDRLTIRGGMQHTVRVEREGESVTFNATADADFPRYTVTKRGDSYWIRYTSINAAITMKVYFTGDSIYLLQNGFVTIAVTRTASSILVNGKAAVTYSRG